MRGETTSLGAQLAERRDAILRELGLRAHWGAPRGNHNAVKEGVAENKPATVAGLLFAVPAAGSGHGGRTTRHGAAQTNRQ